MVVLLHGFPSASHQYARLIDRLSDQFHLLAPDYPGFGYSTAPVSSASGGSFDYTFDHLADITERFLTKLGVDRFFVYVFDFGAPVRFRIAARHPDWILGVIAQNGNAYEVGLGPSMQPAVKYWTDRSGMEDKTRGALTLAATRAQHLDGAADPELVSPDSWTLEQYWMDSPDRAQAMLDLLYDYQSHVALYAMTDRARTRHSTKASGLHPCRYPSVRRNAGQLAGLAAHDGVTVFRVPGHVDHYSHSMVAGGLLLTS